MASTSSNPVADALRQRRSVRHFTEEVVPRETIAALLDEATWAPSGGDDQPWGVVALSPEPARALRDRYEMRAWHALAPKMASIVARHAGGAAPAAAATPSAILDRVLDKLGTEARSRGAPWLLFVHGPARIETDALRLREFHDALASRVPAPEVPTLAEIETMLGPVHEGVIAASIAGFVYAITLAAHARGLATCIQHNWLVFRDALATEIELAPERTLVAGVLVGWADAGDPVVQRAEARATRRPLDVRFR